MIQAKNPEHSVCASVFVYMCVPQPGVGEGKEIAPFEVYWLSSVI